MKTLKSLFLGTVLLFLVFFYPAEGVFAAIAPTPGGPVFYGAAERTSLSGAGDPLKSMTRGEAVAQIVAAFDLQKKQQKFLWDCMKHAEDCFFVFSAMSDYDDIRFYPLILYPDVFPAYKHYNAINTASMLGLVHGYLEEESSPFYPEKPLTRIQALKVVLGAANLMGWKEKFELEALMKDAGGPEESPFEDVPLDATCMWWYHRYLNFALDAGIIGAAQESDQDFRPDAPISEAELAEMITRTWHYSKQISHDNETLTAADAGG